MSGFKYNQQDLDNIFQPISELSYLNEEYKNNEFGVNIYNSTTNLKINGNDIRNRYTKKNGCTVPTDSVVPSTGFKINGTDLNSLLFARTTYVRYEVVVEAEQGKTVLEGNSITGTPSYGSKITIDCWLDSSKQYTVKKCYGGIGGVRSGGGGRRGGNGGNSLMLMEEERDTDGNLIDGDNIVVAGAGGGSGSGNGKYGASAFWKSGTDIMSYADYSYLETDPRLTDYTNAKFSTALGTKYKLKHMESHDGIVYDNIFNGLNAKEHHHWGGGGGWTSGGQGYRANTSGSKYNGGNGTVPNNDSRSSGGGGGGAGYYGGGGGAEVNTSNGSRGSPGGGSGSSYYNNNPKSSYNVTFKKLERTVNTNANITITNKKTSNSTTQTFNGLSSGVNTISLP